jgi:2-dehydro-3-deoxyphosphogluconate aldolase/(4S)-4-hydroxy-2-oxoglutarate aldolase
MNKILEQISLIGIVPVVVIDDEANAVPLAQALVDGGIPCIELTLRTPAAVRSLQAIAKAKTDLILGAGTVLTVDQAKEVIDSGAQWIVSPGFNRKVVDYCVSRNIPVTPGILTPTEVQMAIDAGLEVVKFFPAEAAGGVDYLKAIAAPFKDMRFIPTGGVDESNFLSYLRCPFVIACGGRWMVNPASIAAKNFAEIRCQTAAAVKKMLALEMRHIGMNNADAETAAAISTKLSAILDLPTRDTPGSVFVGTGFEVLKRNHLGAHGHIAIGTAFIDRAVAYLERRGVEIKPETRDVRNGKLHAVYLDLELSGFAFHLLQV